MAKTDSDKTILCIDNDADTCELITFFFEQKGFQVNSFNTPEEAIRRARGGGYGAIITDFHLGETDGTDLCRAIRTFDRKTPIVFLTGEARPENSQAAMEAGAQAYITKPADLELLFQTVIRLMTIAENPQVF